MFGRMGAGSAVKQWASAANTFTAAGTASVSPALPGSGTGRPIKLRASGSVSGQASITIGNTAAIIAPVNPNAGFTEVDIPASAFPSPVGSVTVSVTADGAGTIRAFVGFA